MYLGTKIIEAIIGQPMFKTECPDSPKSGCLTVWNANAAEQIEAVIAEHQSCSEPHPKTGHSFGYALEAAKNGYRIARAGWNGKGMWVCYGQGNPALEAEKFWNPHTRKFAEESGGTAEVLPYLIFKTADNKILMGWLASQTDMLASDWCILD